MSLEMTEALGLYHDRTGDWFHRVVLNLPAGLYPCNWKVSEQSSWDDRNDHNGVGTW